MMPCQIKAINLEQNHRKIGYFESKKMVFNEDFDGGMGIGSLC